MCPSVIAMENESAARADIIELSDYVYQRTRNRLAGLTDDEYFWEPVPGCYTIRRANSGEYRADDASEPDPPPFTTIAWRLWHLIETYGGKRNPEWLGVEREPGGFERDDPAAATAAEAIAVLARAHHFWQDLIQELPTASWSEPLGPIAHLYAESSKAALVLHQLDEQIHHGAELGVMRDLYLHDRAKSARTADHG
jgi:DinB superfamily